MRGAAMSLTAAASGFVVFLLSVSVIQGKNDWGVTYTSTQICAVKRSTVEIPCSYRYPSRMKDRETIVEETFWFTKMTGDEFTDLRTDPEYSDRVQYHKENNDCTLRITDLRESDAAEYKFRFLTNQKGGRFFGSPGVTLSVTDLRVQVMSGQDPDWVTLRNWYSPWVELKCQSSCRRSGRTSYIWYKNGQKTKEGSSSYSGLFSAADSFSCAVKGYEDFPSPSVYAPKLPSVSVSPSAEIMEGSSVTLTCSSDANPAATYTWYKKNGIYLHPVSKEPQLVFRSIQSSGQYFCAAVNELGLKKSQYISINVKYPPKRVSVSVHPSGDIVEGSSVTLTCSSDANPAATYTWYKETQKLSEGPRYHFSSIGSEDRGIYRCKSENQYGRILSSSLSIDVQYAPKLPSVSVSPSGEIVEGSSVNLTCSSDANPAAKYTWYKEDSPKESGQIFTITDFRAEHIGNYYCEAQNKIGRRNNTLHLTVVVAGAGKSAAAAGTITVVLLAVISLCVFLWIRKKRASRELSEPEEMQQNTQQNLPDQRQPEERGDLQYASIRFPNNQADSLYSNITPAQPLRHTQQQDAVEYTAVKFNRARTDLRTRGQETAEDPAALYSTVNKTR